MANCVYILGSHRFSSEVELDDYLSAFKDLHKKYGDEVFSRKWSEVLEKYREKLFSQKELIDNAIKNGSIKLVTDELDVDLDNIVGQFPRKGVTELIKLMRNSNGGLLFPEFRDEEYWTRMKARFAVGNFDDVEFYLPFIFDEQDDLGHYITRPIESEEEFKAIRSRITSIWRQLSLVGSLVHATFKIFYSNHKTAEGKALKNLTREEQIREVKKLLRQDTNYNQLVTKFDNDVFKKGSFLETLINCCYEFDKELLKKFEGEGKQPLMVLPEVGVQGAAVLDINEQKTNIKVVGKLDLVVFTADGDVNIIDFKCSPKEYSKYDDAKKHTFEYQLAVYRRLLKLLGINSKANIRLYVVPIQFTDFSVDKENDRMLLSGVKLRDGSVFEELRNSTPSTNSAVFDKIETDLDLTFIPPDEVEDIQEGEVLSKVKAWMLKVFPQYSKIDEVTDENVREYASAYDRVKYNEESGKWIYRPYKSGEIEAAANTEQELLEKIKADWISERQRRLDKTRDVKEALKRAIDLNAGRNAEFNIVFEQKDNSTAKQVSWAQHMLLKYARKNRYKVLETPEAFDALGLILVKDLATHKIDVIKLSYTFNADAGMSFGNRERTTLLGGFMTNTAAKAQPGSLVMEATRGNIELMEAMYAINCMPSLFNDGGNSYIGDIQLITSRNEGGGANNKSLLWNFNRLMDYSKETSYFGYTENQKSGPIKMASFTQLVSDSLNRILAFHGEERKWSNLREATSNFDAAIGNKEKILVELLQLKNMLETEFKHLKTDGIARTDYDDFSSPEYRLYAEVMLAIGEVGGLKYVQQVNDHAKYWEGNLIKAFLWDGFNGNYIDNPGTLRSETLNQASHLLDVAYQNVRDQLFAYKNDIEKDILALKESKGGSLANVETLYDNFYDKTVKDDLVFKNPFTDGSLNDVEARLLKHVLTDITKRRGYVIRDDSELQATIAEHPELLWVPLIEKSGKSVKEVTVSLLTRLRKFLVNLSPTNIKAWAKSTLEEAVDTEDTYTGEDSVWTVANLVDASRDQATREKMIVARADKGGVKAFETNLEMLALKHEYAYLYKLEIDEVMPFIKALTIHLANQGIILNDNFENDISYIHKFIRAKIQNKSLNNINDLGEFSKLAKDLMVGTSIMALAFNPKQLYQIIDGLWKDIRLIVQQPGEPGAFTFQHFKESFFWIILDIAKSSGDLSVGEGLNLLYGINDMDINQLASRYALDTYGTDRLSKAMFRFASRPDYYNRLTIFAMLMKGDGCFDAHYVKDGKMIYDWTLDKRFDVFAKAKGHESNVSNADLAKFRKLKALYYAMAQEMVLDRTMNPDGTRFVLDMRNPMPLPKAYTVRQSESMKALGDKTYGYYASEKKSLIQAFTLGAMFFQMNTFWSSKKNLYFASRGFTQEGRMVQYEEYNAEDPDHPHKFYLKYNEDTGDFDVVMDEDTGIPFEVWKGRPLEGIIISTAHLLFDLITNRREYEGQRLSELYWKNPDEELARMYRANFRHGLADLFGMVFIGWMVAPSLVNAAKAFAKEIGEETLDSSVLGTSALLFANMFQQSTEDFVFFKSVFGRGTQWTAFSVNTARTLYENVIEAITGKPDAYDTVVKSVAALRNVRPAASYVKLQILGRPYGDNGEQ